MTSLSKVQKDETSLIINKEENLIAEELKNAGKTEEIASLVKFLASDEANYITGQTVHINGGLYM